MCAEGREVLGKKRDEKELAPTVQESQLVVTTEKRRRLEGEALGHGVREAIYEEIEVGQKATRFGVVAFGTPFWEWAVPTGSRLIWIWGADFGDQQFRE